MSYWEEAQGQTQNMGDLVQLDELDKVARVRDFRAMVFLHNGCEFVTMFSGHTFLVKWNAIVLVVSVHLCELEAT